MSLYDDCAVLPRTGRQLYLLISAQFTQVAPSKDVPLKRGPQQIPTVAAFPRTVPPQSLSSKQSAPNVFKELL